MKVNLNGAFHALRTTLPQLQENTGDVVSISSVAAFCRITETLPTRHRKPASKH